MTEPSPDVLPYDFRQFRDVVRHPEAHALVLGQYRLGEWAGVVALRRLLDELEPEARLRRAMEIHFRDEERHSALFTDWIQRLGITPAPLPAEIEGFFSRSPEDYREQRRLLGELPPAVRRVFIFAAINAIERLAYTQFETHLLALDRPGDVTALEGVMAEEKFHLSYVEAELERQEGGPLGPVVATAREQARSRFAEFQETRRAETRHAVERLLGATGGPR
jgi:hypothetical protein